MPPKKPSSHELRVLLVARWLKRYAEVYPMYGKTLADYPDRFNAFLEVLSDLAPESVDAGFAAVMNHPDSNFPVPGQVREAAIQHGLRKAQETPVPRPALPPTNSGSNEYYTKEELGREFQDMLRKSKLRTM